MSDDNLTIGQKLRSPYFAILVAALAGLLPFPIYGFVFSRAPYTTAESALYLLSLFGVGGVLWMMAGYFEIIDRRWMERWIWWGG